IVGAGAAGISIALEFANKQVPVVLLESGGVEYDVETHALANGRMDGTIVDSGAWGFPPTEHYLRLSQHRFFGGTTNCWGGWCRPFDEIDFEQRDWVPHSGWPITRQELSPFYKRAAVLCQIQPFADEPYYTGTPQRPAVPSSSSGLRTELIHVGPPTNFGE